MGIKLESQAEPLPGYRLIERLGGGGFGEVWKAEAPGGFCKAIKFVYGNVDASDEEGARAEQELKALERIKVVRHPFILTLERWEIVEGQLIIVMELADRTLWDRFKECRSQASMGIPREELIGYLREIAEALDFMHSQFQLQHLDIKPQNLFLVHNHVKVADFGLIKDIKGTYASITGGVTPVYAAPETFDGKVYRNTDQYSLAIVYQELLTGKRPFSGTTARQLVLQHLQAQPELAILPACDQAIVAKALQKKHDKRYSNCSEFVEALRTAQRPNRKSTDIPDVRPKPTDQDQDLEDDDDDDQDVDFPDALGQINDWGSPSPEDLAVTRGRPGKPSESNTNLTSQATAQNLTSSEMKVPTEHRTDAGTRTPGFQDPSLQTPPASSKIRSDVFPSIDSGVSMGGNSSSLLSGSGRLSNLTKKTQPPLSDTGVLKPALVIGLGQSGYQIARKFRSLICESFFSLDRMPHLRFLQIDTDEEQLSQATKGEKDGFRLNETLLARLHRASHYIKNADAKDLLESWMDLKSLYRIPRQMNTAGIRALGRLAFVDNYSIIRRRLEAELLATLDPDWLKQASLKTGMRVYSCRPRVYVVTNTAGGTGSGMFLDLAYTLRHVTKKLGMENPDIVGLFLLPHPAQQSHTVNGLVNGFAALTELQHFSASETTYNVIFRTNDPTRPKEAIRNNAPPFKRCLLIPTEEDKPDPRRYESNLNPIDQGANAPSVIQAANLLFTDLCTSLGRAADKSRQEWANIFTPWRENENDFTLYQTLGMYRVVWPRRQLLQKTAHELCNVLIERWMSKDGKPFREGVKEWIVSQWEEMRLSPEDLIARMKQSCEKRLENAPENIFKNLLIPITAEIPPPPEHPNQAKTPPPLPALPLGKVLEALEQMEKLLGLPDGCASVTGNTGTEIEMGLISEILKKKSTKLSAKCELKLAQITVRMIEKPEYRLAGAEETLRQFGEAVDKALELQEELAKEMQIRSANMHKRLLELLENPNKGKPQGSSSWRLVFSRSSTPTPQEQQAQEILDLLTLYPKCRYQAIILHYCSAFYLTLRGQLSDQLREVDFCRQRLKELHDQFSPEPSNKTRSRRKGTEIIPGHLGRILMPEGCRTFEDIVQSIRRQVTTEDFQRLDQQIQYMIRKQFKALVHVCMSSTSVAKGLAPAMQAEAEKFLAPKLDNVDVIQMFLEGSRPAQLDSMPSEIPGLVPHDPDVGDVLEAFDEAAPGLMVTGEHEELQLVALPQTPTTEALRALTQKALNDRELHFAESTDEIVFYREQLHTTLTTLRHLSRQAKDAYDQLAKNPVTTPHSRIDITDWQNLSTQD